MNCEPYPVTELAKRLEGCNDSDFLTILKSLTSSAYINEQLLKSELALLITKTLNLLRSNQEKSIWRGCHTTVVICSFNPLVLCAHAGQLLATVYSKLEQKVEYYSSTAQSAQSKVLLQALTYALSSLINLMRGKPTLSREGLIPKLKVIIPTLITLAQFEPKLSLPILKGLLYKNSTTFKPFANKFRTVLVNLMKDDYESFDRETQVLICENFAYLHLVKIQPSYSDDESQSHHKSYQDDNWRSGMFSVLSQFKPTLDLCGEILDFEQDKELQVLINSLGNFAKYETAAEFLPGLKLDMNVPITLWEVPRRLNLLGDILSAFISLPTPYPVRIPIGACVAISEALLSMTRNFLPLRRDVRGDAELTSVVSQILPQTQFVGVNLISIISQTYGKTCLSMLPSILGSLELFIPLQQKSSKVDLEKCRVLKSEILTVFHVVSSLIPHMGHQLHEIDFFNKSIDVALHLTEDTSSVDLVFRKQANELQNGKKLPKKKQKKDHTSGSLSDLYTHPESFKSESSLRWLGEINHFLRAIMSNWKCPSTQQQRILRYSISTSQRLKEELGYIPESFVHLLRTEILYPGSERVSILPIAVSLLKDSADDVFDLLCHPRLPMSAVHHLKTSSEHIEETSEKMEEDDQSDGDDTSKAVPEMVIDSILENTRPTDHVIPNIPKDFDILEEVSLEEQSKTPQSQETGKEPDITKKREFNEEITTIDDPKRPKINPDITTSVKEEYATLSVHEHGPNEIKSAEEKVEDIGEEDDSEFEMPDIHLSEDEDDEDDEDDE